MAKYEVLLYRVATTPTGTNFWATDGIVALLSGFGGESDEKRLDLLRRKLQLLCDANFRQYMPKIVKLEFGKTYGVHLDHYRIVGFFDQSYRDFIALEYFVKKTQRNDSRMTAIYRKVDSIREANGWTKQN